MNRYICQALAWLGFFAAAGALFAAIWIPDHRRQLGMTALIAAVLSMIMTTIAAYLYDQHAKREEHRHEHPTCPSDTDGGPA